MRNSISLLSILSDVQSARMHRFRFENLVEMEEHKYFHQALTAGLITTTDQGRYHSSAGYLYCGVLLTHEGEKALENTLD